MYQVGVKDTFSAQHRLVGGDWGAENALHEHAYRVEVLCGGAVLDRHGFLLDIVALRRALSVQRDRFSGKVLNALPEFRGLNPSLEHLAQILCRGLWETLNEGGLQLLRVVLWESDDAWASFTIRGGETCGSG